MRSILIHYLLPLALPTLVYLSWIYYCRKRADEGQEPPAVTRGGLFWAVFTGGILTIIGLVALGLSTGGDPSATYQSPQFKDGRIIGPNFKE